MQETEFDLHEWKDFLERLDKSIKQVPNLKKNMLEQVGSELEDAVRRQIEASGLNDRRGRVRSWQNSHIGSGLGYVAIRSDSVEVQSGGGNRQRLNAGALTNFLTSGHKVRGPSGRSKRYVPRARMARVPGFGFYKNTSSEAEKIALYAANEFLEKIKESL